MFPDGTLQVTAASGGGGDGYWTLYNNHIYNNNSGYVGIGTGEPTSHLEVHKTYGSGAEGALEVTTEGSYGTWVKLTFDGGTINATNSFGDNILSLNDTSSADVYLANGGGNVGIGTGSPLASLHVEDTDQSLPVYALYSEDLIIEDDKAVLGLYCEDGTNHEAAITFGELGNSILQNKWAIYRGTAASPALSVTYGGDPDHGNNAQMMRIWPNGYVSIGPHLAQAKLHVDGNVRAGQLHIDQDAMVGGDATVVGTASVGVLQITGADVAEKFPVSERVKPGMVVAIDPDRPGKLCLARGAYNRCVAGVVSGANDLPVGAVLGNLPGQEDSPPIALTGRVWCWCDASYAAIEPGDRLTTSSTPGHAMKVTDDNEASGAVIGKAMTRLAQGKGLVLVLVQPQ
jgi:hypothetical protein